MAKSKSPPPEIPASFEQMMELAPLLMDMLDFQRSTNNLGNTDMLSTLILSAVTVAEADGCPMTAAEITFLLEIPRRAVDSKLKRLIKTGIIELDGERYRYNPQRPLTPDEERQFDNIQRAFDELSPVLKKLKKPLDS